MRESRRLLTQCTIMMHFITHECKGELVSFDTLGCLPKISMDTNTQIEGCLHSLQSLTYKLHGSLSLSLSIEREGVHPSALHGVSCTTESL